MIGARLHAAAQASQDRLARAMRDYENMSLTQAMRYAVQGGKGIRGFLVIEGAALFGIEQSASVTAAAAVEALHAYSLVHDDLPAMDDDALRRGRPTVHKKWDEATAILVGDALQTLAYDLLTRPEAANTPLKRLELISNLAQVSGANGMVLGQTQDILAQTAPPPSLEDVSTLQRNKTGALIKWAATAGAVMAGKDTAPLEHYAAAFGLAFQIVDDVLDIEGDAAIMGKATRKDANCGKATFVSVLGLQAAKNKIEELTEQACDALSPYGARADILQQAARYIAARKK